MTNLKIVEQLLNGYHLEPKELKQAEQILHGLKGQLESRVNKPKPEPKKNFRTMDVTPTWAGLLPTLLELTKSDKPEPRKIGEQEILKMAKCADAYNELIKTEVE